MRVYRVEKAVSTSMIYTQCRSKLTTEEFIRRVILIPDDFKHREVTIHVGKKWFYVDGFDPITNTIYEFNGDSWHGNTNIYNATDFNKQAKKTYGELFEKNKT